MSDAPLPEITPKIEPVKVLDIQHDTDPADDQGLARRTPHMGHTALFLSIMMFSICVCIVVALAAVHGFTTALNHPFAATIGQIVGYVLTFLIAVPIFPLFWRVSFWQGIHWNPRPARLNWWKLLIAGVLASVIAALVAERFSTGPTKTDITQLFATPLSAWLTVTIGTFVPTFVEEVMFRGFLLTSLAIAYDWLAFPRTPAGIDRWQRTNAISPAAWTFGALVSSIAFASLHGFQIHWAKGPLIALLGVSLLLSYVRIRLRSVAASTLVHMAYDGFIFCTMIAATGGFRHMDKLR